MASREESALGRLLARAADLPPPVPLTSGDVARLSEESLARDVGEDPRQRPSQGSLRLHGPAVHNNMAELSSVAAVASSWQRAVTAVAASLEGQRDLRGRIKGDIIRRSRLLLSAAPQAGSIVLAIEAGSLAMDEVEPGGEVALFDRPRPLADRAIEQLIALASELQTAQLGDLDAAAQRLRELGPRVASAIRSLAQSIENGALSFDAAWSEPDQITVRSSWTSSTARWVKEFVDGRDLDSEIVELVGRAITVSASDKWLMEVADNVEERRLRIDASQLSLADTRKVRVDDMIRLSVRIAAREQADGSIRVQRHALSVELLAPEEVAGLSSLDVGEPT